MAKKKPEKKGVTGIVAKKEVFNGNKSYERIVITRKDDVGYLKATYYDIRVFNADNDNLHPTKKGITISERTLKRIVVFLTKDLFSLR